MGSGAAPRDEPLPADWEPNREHRAQAQTVGADIAHEARCFRAKAEAEDWLRCDWDAVFGRWLVNVAEYGLSEEPEEPEWDDRPATWALPFDPEVAARRPLPPRELYGVPQPLPTEPEPEPDPEPEPEPDGFAWPPHQRLTRGDRW